MAEQKQKAFVDALICATKAGLELEGTVNELWKPSDRRIIYNCVLGTLTPDATRDAERDDANGLLAIAHFHALWGLPYKRWRSATARKSVAGVDVAVWSWGNFDRGLETLCCTRTR